jgi:hypothetical protein
VSLQEEEKGPRHIQREDRMWTQGDDIDKPRREDSEEINPANTLQNYEKIDFCCLNSHPLLVYHTA